MDEIDRLWLRFMMETLLSLYIHVFKQLSLLDRCPYVFVFFLDDRKMGNCLISPYM